MINRAHGGNIWSFLENNQQKLIDFSANINPLGISPKVRGVILKHLDKLSHYPDPESKNLKEDLATFHNIKTDNLLIGNGSIELIHLVPRALKVKSALIVRPTFSEYEFAVRLNKAKTIFLRAEEKDDFRISPHQIKKFIPQVDLIFICNPNNPTGFKMNLRDVLSLLKLCTKYKTVLLIDEVFIDFAQNPEKLTLLTNAIQNKHILVLRSLTKFFGIAGLRLGYLIGEPNLIYKISAAGYPWNVNVLAQLVGREIIKDKEYIKKSKEFILKETAYLFNNLKKIKGLKIYPPSANFIFCKLENTKEKNVSVLSKKLLTQNILIRNCENFKGLDNKFFRVAVRTRDENDRLILNLIKILQ